VAQLARQMFPGGVKVDGSGGLDDAIQAHVSESQLEGSAIFEAAFENGGIAKPPINGFFVRRQRVLGQAKAGMEKRLIVLVRRVEILN
jgi:hypothetical protein